eukprot:m.87294 g.87294  ORF g.87294 m.87294 type:complete len:499 (-) comp13101_c1_seq1:2017-3513(-)
MANSAKGKLRSALLVLLLVLEDCGFSVTAARTRRSDKYDYGVMMDAGSTGTRCYVYFWPAREDESVPLVEPLWDEVNQKELSLKAGPISAGQYNLKDLDDVINPLVEFAKEHVPASQTSSTRIYLYATAGMRILDYDSQDKIMSRVSALLSNSGFAFSPQNVAIITGQAEAYFAWLSTNFLAGSFKSDAASDAWGALDLGGASTQIASTLQVCSDGDKACPKYALPGMLEARFNGKTYTILAQSYLGYGSNLFAEKIYSQTYEEGINPCYPIGSEANFTVDGVSKSINGSSDPTSCASLAVVVGNLTDTTSCFSRGGACEGYEASECRCGIEGSMLPVINEDVKFLAMSGYQANIASNLGLPSTGSWPKAVVEQISEVCSMNITEAQARMPGVPINYVTTTCQTGNEIIMLLNNSYGLEMNDVNFDEKVGKFEVTWALGAMVSEANLLPSNPTSARSKLTREEEGLIAGVSVALVLGSLVLVIYMMRYKRKTGKYEQM